MADNTPTTLTASSSFPAADTPGHADFITPGFPGSFLAASSAGANQANAVALAGAAFRTTFCAGFTVTGTGATNAAQLAVTLSDGTTTLNYTLAFPATTTTTAVGPLHERFDPPLPSALGAGWTLTVPAFGSGNTASSASIRGYRV